jgi:hemerythrin-like domain-containing protein
MKDPVEALAYDHGDLNRQVRLLRARFRSLQTDGSNSAGLLSDLYSFRDTLFLHFAREEEALFPFVAENVPELREQVETMTVTHDTVCGALARMVHLASTDTPLAAIAPLFARFESTYSAHAHNEAKLLHSLADRLDADQRTRLLELVERI